MDVLELKAVQDFIRCCTDGWDHDGMSGMREI